MAFFGAFGVDLFKLAFQIINFLLILYLLNRFLFKRVLALLDERQERISKGLEDAEAAARDRELARAEREAALDEARKEAERRFDELRALDRLDVGAGPAEVRRILASPPRRDGHVARHEHRRRQLRRRDRDLRGGQ